MKKFHSALCAIATLAMAFSLTACEKKQIAPPKPAEPVKKQEYKSQPKPQAQPEQKSAAPQPKQTTGYNK